MKKILCFTLLLWAAGLYAAENCSKVDSTQVLPTCIAIDTSASGSTYTSATINTYTFRNLGVQAKCVSGPCAVIINVDCRSQSNLDWFTCATITNPAVADANGVGGAYLSLPRSYQYRINVPASTFTTGSIAVNFERYNN